MSEKLNVSRVRGVTEGQFKVKAFTANPRKAAEPSILFVNKLGTEAEITFDIAAGIAVFGADTIVDSTAVDVAGLVVDFNSLLASLRTIGIIK